MAIYCELKKGMGLGNQLWTILSTKGIATRMDVPHFTAGYDEFLAQDFLEVNTKSIDKIPPAINRLAEKSFHWKEGRFQGCLFDDRLLKLDAREDWHIVGLLQDERYLQNTESFLKISGRLKNFDLRNVIICNVRGGEYRLHKRFQLKIDYWLRSIAQMRTKYPFLREVIAVSDDADYCRKLGIFDKIYAGGIEQTYRLLSEAEYVICSNTTFSYFPLRANNNLKCVVAPAYFNRPHQQELWCSPQNYYRSYQYIDSKGKILSEIDAKTIVAKTEEQIYEKCEISDYGSLDITQNFMFKKLIPHQLKIILKKIIQKILKV